MKNWLLTGKLVLILLVLLWGKTVLAYSNSYNFDEESDTSIPINQWSNNGYTEYERFKQSGNNVLATSSVYMTAPNSLDTYYGRQLIGSTTNPTELVVWFRDNGSWDSATLYDIYGAASSSTWTFVVHFKKSTTLSLESSSKVLKSGITTNEWHRAAFYFYPTYFSTYVDNVFAATSTYLGTFANTAKFWFFASDINEKFYIDNIGIVDDLYYPSSSEFINFTKPTEGSYYTLADFNWGYEFKIATTSYWTTYDWLNVDLVFTHYTEGVVDATTSLIVLRDDITKYNAGTLYTKEITDRTSFPPNPGAYQAVIALKGVYSNGTTDTLAFDAVTFGIATTTDISKINTGWCDSLCTYSDDIFNSVKCAGIYVGCYFFYPTPGQAEYIKTQYDKILTKFPFNVVSDIGSTIYSAAAGTSTSTMPTWTLQIGSTTATIPVMDTNVVNRTIGTSTFSTVRTVEGYSVYAAYAVAMYFFIMAII